MFVYGGASRVIRLGDLQAAAAPSTSPDAKDGALNANVVLRWEYRATSTLFLVYTRSSSPLVDLAGRTSRLDLAGAPKGPAQNALVLKLSYWWG